MRARLLCCIACCILTSCTSVLWSRRTPQISATKFEVSYQESAELARNGQVGAMREVMIMTTDFDGESAFTHGMNLLALYHLQRRAFAQALAGLDPEEARAVKSSLDRSQSTFQQIVRASKE